MRIDFTGKLLRWSVVAISVLLQAGCSRNTESLTPQQQQNIKQMAEPPRDDQGRIIGPPPIAPQAPA